MNCIFTSKKEKHDKAVPFSPLKGYYNLTERHSYAKRTPYNVVKHNKNINLKEDLRIQTHFIIYLLIDKTSFFLESKLIVNRIS